MRYEVRQLSPGSFQAAYNRYMATDDLSAPLSTESDFYMICDDEDWLFDVEGRAVSMNGYPVGDDGLPIYPEVK